MSFRGFEGGESRNAGVEAKGAVGEDPELESALRNFRSSVRAWSDAAYRQPRLVEVAPRGRVWRRAAAWALGSVLVAAGTVGTRQEYQHWQEMDRLARLRQQQELRRVEEQKAREAEQELAKVDTAVSREVPDALEPLAQLMAADEGQ